MTMLTVSTANQIDTAPSPLLLEPQQWLAALAMLVVLFTPYQTLVQTVITDDSVRLGVEGDSYDMIWVNVGYLVGLVYGLFAGVCQSVRFGKRYTLAAALVIFCIGNVLCGAATGIVSLAIGRGVEGFGKLMAMAVGRAALYKHFDHALLVAIGFYGIFGYSTRYCTPLINAYLDVYLSWRWMYWAYVPVGLLAAILVWCFFRPDRPAKPIRLPIDWLAVTAFVVWVIAIDFAFSWYRKWGGWSSNAFVATAALCVALPLALAAWLASGLSWDEHLKRILRSRVYVYCLTIRGLFLLHMVAVLSIVGMYCTELRGYPRIVTGWIMVPTSLAMATTTFLTTWFHRRSMRHVWLIVGFIGASACVWWLSSIDNFTAKEHVAVMLACWGAFLGLIPPVFLSDEVEGLDPRDLLYGFSLGLVGLVVPITTVPNATGTMVKAWSDRAVDVYRLNLRENRPAVEQASARVADYFHQRGLSGPALQQETSRVLGGFATLEGVAHGFRSGLRFLSLMMLGLGLFVAIALARAGRGLRAPPGAGYT
jgi:MFS family permease